MSNKSERMNLKGIAVYPHLNKADTKFVPQGEFKTGLRMTEEEAKPLMARLSKIFQEHTGKKLNKHNTNLWKIDEDDQGEPAGTITFQAKVKNVLRKDGTSWERKPKQYDSQAKLTEVQVTGGSELVVACDIYAWDAGSTKGISLQPVAIQIINLVEYAGGGHGFDIVEGGFVGDAAPKVAEAGVVEEAAEEDADDFDF